MRTEIHLTLAERRLSLRHSSSVPEHGSLDKRRLLLKLFGSLIFDVQNHYMRLYAVVIIMVNDSHPTGRITVERTSSIIL